MTSLSTRIAAAGLLAAGLSAAPGAAWSAPADTVTVHRGAVVTTVGFDAKGIEVGRGQPLTVPAPRAKPPAGASLRMVAGRRLWLVDAEAGRLTACAVHHTTQVGRRVVRCTTRNLPD